MPTAQVRTPPAAANRPFARYAWAVLGYNMAVALWGAFVRATDSGAGCGNHWPLCQGEITPHSPTLATIIEFTHRATSGIDLILVALLLVWAFRAFPKHHPARFGAALSSVFLMTEALIGAALVLLEHVAKNASPNRAYSLSTHLVNTLTLLACLTLTAWWGMGKARLRMEGRAARLAGISVAAVVVLGVSGAIAALGDTLFPATSLAVGLAQDFNPASSIFVRLRWVHPAVAVLGGAWLFYFGLSALGRAQTRRPAALMLGMLAAQLLAGAMNLLLLAPVWLQMVHLLIAYLLWMSLVLLCASMLSEKTPAVHS
jgi:heme A synthase